MLLFLDHYFGRLTQSSGAIPALKEEDHGQPNSGNLIIIINMVFDWPDRQAEFREEVGGYFQAGKLKHKETVVEGIDQAVGAFLGLFQGHSAGKMVAKLA